MTADFDQIDWQALAREHGTPLYIYSETRIAEQYRRLSAALKNFPHRICYAVKANSNLALLSYLAKIGCGFDVVSEGEMRRAVAAGGRPGDIVFSGVGKRATEIEHAITGGIRMLNVESEAELDLIERIAIGLGRPADIAFRVNPRVNVDTHPYLATGLATSKFGITIELASALAKRAIESDALNLVGVDCHIGSQIHEVDALRSAYSQVLELAQAWRGMGAPIRYLDFGGGLAVDYSGHYRPLDLQEFSAMLSDLAIPGDYELIFEPGKFLVAGAGILLTEVLAIKTGAERSFVIVDAGMNDLIRPALYQAFHEIEPAVKRPGAEREVDIVGPVCESGCYLAENRRISPLERGDLLIVKDAGAYCFSMASNYNSRRLPAEVWVAADGSVKLIRRREQYEELWVNEIIPW